MPATHAVHVALADAPSPVRYVPGKHCVHAIAPGTSEYFPAAHLAHVPELSAPDAVENLPASHCWQTDEVAAPTVTE